jgi:hypothetical protein
MKDRVIQNLLAKYVSTSWNTSVWTYSYILKLIEFFECDIQVIATRLYEELSHHFTKKDETSGQIELVGSYDNVFNATCKMIEILDYLHERYGTSVSKPSDYAIDDVVESADIWVLDRVQAGKVSDQDVCYCLLYLLKNNRYESLDAGTRARLLSSLDPLLLSISSTQIKHRDSVDLCRIYQTVALLSVHAPFAGTKTPVEYLRKIESILKERQDLYGNWKNISETAEITAMLLEVYANRSAFDGSLTTINTLVTKGIEVLHSQYDPKSGMWADDLATTAKAMYAIAQYDKTFNFAINDFFLDLKTNQDARTTLSSPTSIETVAELYTFIDSLETERETLQRQAMTDANRVRIGKERIKRAKTIASLLLGALLSLGFLLFLLFRSLYQNHGDVLNQILVEWYGYIFAGVFGLIVFVFGTFLYTLLSKNIEKV